MIRWAVIRGHPSSVLTRDTEAGIPKKIRWFTRHGGEKRGSWVNHYAFLMSNLTNLVEALAGGVEKTELSRYNESETTWGVIVEHVGYSPEQHCLADGVAIGMVDAPYGFLSIAKQVPDGLLGKLLGRDVYFFRRLRLAWIAVYICSEAGVRIHKKTGWIFMALKTIYRKEYKGIRIRVYADQVLRPLPAKRATPDCIWDDIFEHRPWFYRIRGEINPELRPAGLLTIHTAKIDGDLAFID